MYSSYHAYFICLWLQKVSSEFICTCTCITLSCTNTTPRYERIREKCKQNRIKTWKLSDSITRWQAGHRHLRLRSVLAVFGTIVNVIAFMQPTTRLKLNSTQLSTDPWSVCLVNYFLFAQHVCWWLPNMNANLYHRMYTERIGSNAVLVHPISTCQDVCSRWKSVSSCV